LQPYNNEILTPIYDDDDDDDYYYYYQYLYYRSLSIVHSRTKATEFVFVCIYITSLSFNNMDGSEIHNLSN
jgi:hypothetical protein